MSSKFSSLKRGFSLIELLVVIVIIGILSSFLLANFVGARQKGRDTVRKSDLRQMQSALEFYRADKGGYPDSSSVFSTCGGEFKDTSSTYVVYLKKIPCDPSTQQSYTYMPIAGTPITEYTLVACLENGNDAQAEGQGSCLTGFYQYTLSNP